MYTCMNVCSLINKDVHGKWMIVWDSNYRDRPIYKCCILECCLGVFECLCDFLLLPPHCSSVVLWRISFTDISRHFWSLIWWRSLLVSIESHLNHGPVSLFPHSHCLCVCIFCSERDLGTLPDHKQRLHNFVCAAIRFLVSEDAAVLY